MTDIIRSLLVDKLDEDKLFEIIDEYKLKAECVHTHHQDDRYVVIYDTDETNFDYDRALAIYELEEDYEFYESDEYKEDDEYDVYCWRKTNFNWMSEHRKLDLRCHHRINF